MAKQPYIPKWIKANPIEERLPSAPACYVFYFKQNDGTYHLSYVGSTQNLHNRICNHSIEYCRYSNKVKTNWKIVPDLFLKYKLSSDYGDWAMLELKLIRRLKPCFNKKSR